MKKLSNIKRKTVLLVVGVLILLLIVFGATYAYFAILGEGVAITEGSLTGSGLDNLYFTKGNDISLAMTQDNLTEGGVNLSSETNPSATLIAKDDPATASYNVFLNVYNNTFIYSKDVNTPEILVKITNPAGVEITNLDGLTHTTANGVSGFDITTFKGVINVASDYSISSSDTTVGTTQTWSFEFFVLNLDTNQALNSRAMFGANIIMQAEDVIESPLITEEIITTQTSSNGLLKHTASLANSAGDDSYRYSGSNDVVDNYIIFNDELWRIIGIFDGNIKIIKETSIGTYEFDSGDDDSWADDDGGAELNQLLNNYYFNSTLAPNLLADCGGSGRGSCDFTTTGLDATARAMVETSTWYLGAPDSWNQTANVFYNEERGTLTSSGTHITTEANIGLMYISDYGYAASSNAWTTNLFDYATNSIPASNWMYSGVREWSISPSLTYSDSVWLVYYFGDVLYGDARNGYEVLPTLYLKSEVITTGGNGTKENPFVVTIPPSAATHLIENHGAEEGLYQHTTDLANGAGDDNYRYSGPDTLVKNYVTFNDEMWRIIGVFDGNVKLIKETSVGTYKFDPADDNSWADEDGGAEGNQLLNNYYFNSTVAPNLLADCGAYSKGSCDFTSTGLDATARAMVETSTWYLGAPASTFQTARAIYTAERGSTTSDGTHITTEANIGLMYLSDYGYAASSNAWTTNLYNYDTNSIPASNWMYRGISEWTISPDLAFSDSVWYVNEDGYAFLNSARIRFAWRPTLYLKAETKIVGGTGTESDPFQLGL